MKTFLLTIATLFVSSFILGQTTTENYVKTISYQAATKTGSVANDDKIEIITYYDGLGRSKQNISVRAGGNNKDIITHLEYDNLGRQIKEYLPYAKTSNEGGYKTDALSATNNFYNTAKYENTPNPYSEKKFESSPKNKVIQQASPGADWQLGAGHEITFDYQMNKENEVRKYYVSLDANYVPTLQLGTPIYYTEGALKKTITKDENWTVSEGKNHTTEEFIDFHGRVILKRTYADMDADGDGNIDSEVAHDTYYVYDGFGNLTYVIPPKAEGILFSKVSTPQDNNIIRFDHKLFTGVGGGGGVTVTITETEINVSFSAGFQSTKLLNTSVDIGSSCPLPDMFLGYFNTTPSYGNSFGAYIEDGKLKLVNFANQFITGFGGNLTKTLSPSCAGQMSLITYEVNSSILNDLCYQYVYDYRNRLIKKKIPGKGWESIVYDNLDRPVLTQDALLKAQGKWLFTKYDVFGRVIYTGIYTSGTSVTRASLQSTFTSKSPAQNYETKSTSADVLGIYYSNADFPNSSLEVHTVNYYDNYTFDANGLNLPSSAQTQIIVNYNNATSSQILTKGLATGSKIRVLDSNPVKWITTLTGYNDKGQPIYVASNNNYLETTDIISSKLDFVGKVEKTVSTHTKGAKDPVVITDVFDYDQMGRLLSQVQYIGNENDALVLGASSDTNISYLANTSITLTPGFTALPGFTASITGGTSSSGELIVSNTYDELGQLKNKKVGGTDITGTTGLQTVDYSYNIRGWLKQINNPTSLGTDLFAFKLNYNTKELGSSNALLYNGNISETIWKTANDVSGNKTRGYAYTYDDLNRITGANYGVKTTGSYNLSSGFDVGIGNYDKNGNINSLWREDITNGHKIDQLTYNYHNSEVSNRLKKVEDTSGSTEGFKNGANITEEYTYDVNGNMIKDTNKGITSITYNHLNLPTKVTLNNGNISYFYDATGVKLKKIVSTGATTEYAGNYIYEGGDLKFFNQSEGYVEPDVNGGYNYVYQYKDHLGNIRLSYKDTDGNGSIATSEIVEENNYYPFGLKHKGYNSNINGVHHKYGFGGKEEQDDDLGGNKLDWLDFGARMYDPAIGRWNVTDGKGELYFANSPYNYALNTPTNAVDPDGNLVIFINGLGGGGASYWRNFDSSKSNWLSQPNKVAFDQLVMNKLGDHNSRYIDGSPGSIFNNFTSGQRYKQGYQKGEKLAASLIGSLARDPQGNITETIKIITHSMGGIYGKGFVSALKNYIRTSKDPQVRKALITLVADFDPFQAGGGLGKADKDTFTQQFINSGWSDLFGAGWLANQEEEGADEVTNNENKTSHFIETFSGNIDDLQEGTYEWNENTQEWNCTTCNND